MTNIWAEGCNKGACARKDWKVWYISVNEIKFIFIIFYRVRTLRNKNKQGNFLAMKINTFFKFNSPKLGQLETKWAENLTLSTGWGLRFWCRWAGSANEIKSFTIRSGNSTGDGGIGDYFSWNSGTPTIGAFTPSKFTSSSCNSASG